MSTDDNSKISNPLPWIRLYTDAYRNPKVCRLSDSVHRFWLNCLCLAGENGGLLPAEKDICFHLRMSARSVSNNLSVLKEAGLVDPTPSGFTPHNWSIRQYKSDVSTERVRRFRQAHGTPKNCPTKRRETVSETAPDTEQIQIQIQSRQQTTDNKPEIQEPPPPPVRTFEWPQADAAVRSFFAACDVRFTERIVRAAVQQFCSFDSPKIPPLADCDIASAIRQAFDEAHGRQSSAGLFLKTVPQVISTWCIHGRHTNGFRKLVNPDDEAILAVLARREEIDAAERRHK